MTEEEIRIKIIENNGNTFYPPKTPKEDREIVNENCTLLLKQYIDKDRIDSNWWSGMDKYL